MSDTLDTPTGGLPIPGSFHQAVAAVDAAAGAHFMPSGNWVVLCDPRELKRRDKKEIIRAANADGISAIDSGYAVTEGLMAKLVTEWSYPFPIPAEDPASLDEIPAADEGPLFELLEPARLLLFPKPVTPDDHADERSPTAHSGE